MCKVGIISKRATDYLMKHGYEDSKNIEGGINMYGKLYDPDIVNL
jgi:rhodanese-related sulfurtransferase